MTNDQFEREVRKVLDAKLDKKDRDKYVKMLKATYRARTQQIIDIVKDYEGEK